LRAGSGRSLSAIQTGADYVDTGGGGVGQPNYSFANFATRPRRGDNGADYKRGRNDRWYFRSCCYCAIHPRDFHDSTDSRYRPSSVWGARVSAG